MRTEKLHFWMQAILGNVRWASREKSRLTHLLLQETTEGAVRTLDIGCGNGYFAWKAAAQGTSCIGITIHEAELRRCEALRNHLGIAESRLRFKLQSLKDFALREPEASFDQVLMLDVLEHIRDDLGTLKTVHRLLAKDGFLFVTVPNRDYERSTKERHVQRRELGWHIRHSYTFEQLEARLEAAGFEPVDRRAYGNKGSRLIIEAQRRVFRNHPVSLLLFPLFYGVSALLSWWRDPHTLLVIARKRDAAEDPKPEASSSQRGRLIHASARA